MRLKNCSVFLVALGIFAATNVMAEEAKPEAHNMMLKADTNNDGKITYDEFKAAHEKRMEEHFKRMDKNGDGAIDESERQAMHEKMHEMREKRMHKHEMMKPEADKTK